jgi:putative transport protein
MFDYLLELLRGNGTAALFVVLGFGFLIGRLGFRGFTLGPVAGVLLAGLVFGHYGFTISGWAQSFGFAMFIFCVGYQAGPRFIDVMLEDGPKYLALALVVAATGFVLAASMGRLLQLEPGATAGLLAGAMTTTSTLAAAQDALLSGLAPVPEGWLVEDVVTNVGTSYAITYLFGVIGLILTIKFLPALLRTDLPAEAAKLDAGETDAAAESQQSLRTRAYRIGPNWNVDEPLGDLDDRHVNLARIIRARRDGKMLELRANTALSEDDEIAILGDHGYFVAHGDEIGDEIFDRELLDSRVITAQVVVSNADVVGKKVGEIDDLQRLNLMLTGMKRMRVAVPINPDTMLKHRDVLTFTGPEEEIEALRRVVGYVERDVLETDLLTFGIGIVAGLTIGSFAVTVGGVPLTLGAAGGLLISGLTVGFMRSVRPTFGRVPGPALWLLMELGLLMFMAGVGANAGADIVDTLATAGLRLVLAGIVVTIVPVLVAYAFGRLVLGFNPALLLGGITGAMTSGASLSIITAASKSNAPALGYTGAYAFANVILTLAGSLILLVV